MGITRMNQRGSMAALNPGASTRRRKERDGEEMDETALVAFLGRKIVQSMNDEDGDVSDDREENYNYYMGKLYGNEREGYSKFVTREVLEAIEWVLPAILRVFVSGDEVVSFEPETVDDEEQAKQETEIVNNAILKGNNGQGFIALHHWFKDALMNPNGYIKVYMEQRDTTEVGTYRGLNEFGLEMINSDPEIEILEQRTRTEFYQGQPLQVFDLKTRTKKTVNKLCLDPIPPEEMLIDNDLTTLSLDDEVFVCHRTRKSYTKLVQEGHDPDELDEVGASEDHRWNDERVNRLFYDDESPDAEDEDDDSMRMFWVHECYCMVDFNGDGLAEYRRVLLIGDKVFENDETNYQPNVSLASILIPHRHIGLSLADIVKDIQLLSSTLVRQLLDSIYRSNLNRKYFNEDSLTEDGSTMEAMLNAQAEYIPVRGLPGNAVLPEQFNPIANDVLPVLDYVGGVKKLRTGVSPEVSIDPNMLQEVRQEVFTGAVEQASQRVEMLIRIFAETGVRSLMLKVHQLMRSNWDIVKTMKIRGKWVNVDPTGWKDRTDLTVNTGLGFNSKQTTLMLLSQLMAMQKEAMQAGLTDAKRIYRMLSKWMKAAGLGEGSQAFIDPESQEYQPPQPAPDPNMILAQAQAEALKVDSQTKQFKAQTDYQLNQTKVQGEQARTQAEAAEKRLDREVKLRELAIKQFDAESKARYSEAELQAKIEDIRESTRLKASQGLKSEADALKAIVEAGETSRQAKAIVERQRQTGESGDWAEGSGEDDSTDDSDNDD